MTKPDDVRSQIIATAEATLRGDLEPLWGARLLYSLWHGAEDIEPLRNHGVFQLLRYIDSETDRLALGPPRAYWSAEALAEVDEVADRMRARCLSEIRQACEYLIQRFSSDESASDET
jgi:hypothetical protein